MTSESPEQAPEVIVVPRGAPAPPERPPAQQVAARNQLQELRSRALPGRSDEGETARGGAYL